MPSFPTASSLLPGIERAYTKKMIARGGNDSGVIVKAGCRVLLADDHPLVRAGIRSLLEGIEGIAVVAEASDGAEAVRLTQELRPDLVIVDITMKPMNGLDALREIKKVLPQTLVIVLSMHVTEGFVMQSLKLGASGYLLKDAATSELELAVRAVRRGERYLSPAVSRQLVEKVIALSESRQTAEANPLTARQQEILRLIALGNATKEIAYSLGLSVKTVEAHRAQIMERLGIRDIPGLVLYAVRNGIITLDEPGHA